MWQDIPRYDRRTRDRPHVAGHPEVRSAHAPVLHDLPNNPIGGRRRHGEGEVLGPGDDRGVNTNDTRAGVNERATGVAWIKCHIRLDDTLDHLERFWAPA